MSQINVGKINTSVGVQLPSFETALLPTTDIEAGFLAYDETTQEVKYFDGENWRSLDDTGTVSASGGDKYNFGNKTIHKFTGSENFTIQSASAGSTMDILIVGGGGAGGAADGNCSNGGGGGGGLIYIQGIEMTAGTYPIVIGSGGSGFQNTDRQGDSGGNTTFYGYTALGGGGGGGGGAVDGGRGRTGGSGGGGGHPYSGPRAAALQPGSASGGNGFQGGAGNNSSPQWGGGGGGGAAEQGTDGTSTIGGKGGDGFFTNIDGVPKYYGGGGAGAICGNGGIMIGGKGGGGNSGSYNLVEYSSGPGFDGGNGLGGGGGGAGYNPSYRSKGGDGGDGIVIISYTGDYVPDPTVGSSQTNPAVNAYQILEENPGASDGTYWIKPEGWPGAAQEVYCDMSGGGWMLVASSNASSSLFPGDNNRRSASYYIDRTGPLGTPSPDTDYLIGSLVNDLNWQNARVIAFGYGSTNNTYSWTNRGEWISATWLVNGGGKQRLLEVHPRSQVNVGGTSSLSGTANYFAVDGIQKDLHADNSWDANSNQITIGGVGTNGQYADPSSGTYLGHGTNEGSFEGWYRGDNSRADCQGYTTWVR